MIFQAWVTDRCNGRASEAIRRIEAVAGEPIDANRVYRALRRPVRFPVRFAQLVVTASGGDCSLVDLMDREVIAAHFRYGDPDLHRAALCARIIKLERRLQRAEQAHERAASTVDSLLTDLENCRRQLAELADAAPLSGTG